MPSSISSSNCRIDWRPSRLQSAALASVGLLAAMSIWLSAVPPVLAAPLSIAALLRGLQLARRERMRPPATLAWRHGEARATWNFGGDARSWTDVRARFRGPLATVSGIDDRGRRQHRHWWPDTLAPQDRRSLRLAADAAHLS